MDAATTTTLITTTTSTTAEPSTTTTTTTTAAPTTTTTSTTTTTKTEPPTTTTSTTTSSAPTTTTTTTTTSTGYYDSHHRVYEKSERQEVPQHASRAFPSDPQTYDPSPTRNHFQTNCIDCQGSPDADPRPDRSTFPNKKVKIKKRCDNIQADWNCSSGINQHSICIRQCPSDFHSESIKCKCKHHQCRWEQKGKPCTWTRRLETLDNQGSAGWDGQASSSGQVGSPELTGYPQTAPEIVPQTAPQAGSQTEQHLMNSIIDSVKGNSVFGENFSSNFDLAQRSMQPEVLNFTPGFRALRGNPSQPTGNRLTGSRPTGNGPIGNGELGQTPDDITQLLRDIKLHNTGHMVFNVNYFNNYASTL